MKRRLIELLKIYSYDRYREVIENLSKVQLENYTVSTREFNSESYIILEVIFEDQVSFWRIDIEYNSFGENSYLLDSMYEVVEAEKHVKLWTAK